jgi:hypothetical protein
MAKGFVGSKVHLSKNKLKFSTFDVKPTNILETILQNSNDILL